MKIRGFFVLNAGIAVRKGENIHFGKLPICFAGQAAEGSLNKKVIVHRIGTGIKFVRKELHTYGWQKLIARFEIQTAARGASLGPVPSW